MVVPNSSINVVLHDLDNTHIKTAEIYAKNFEEQFGLAKTVFGESFAESVMKSCEERKMRIFDAAGVAVETHPNAYGYTFYKEALAFGKNESESHDIADEAYRIAMKVFDPEIQRGAGIYENSKEFLDFLEKRGVKNYLVTLGSEWSQFGRVKNMRYDKWFSRDNIYVVNFDKYPTIETICDKFNYDKNRVAFIGDSWGSDIAASLKAGILPIYVNRKDVHTLHSDKDNGDKRVIRVNSLGEIMDNYGNLFGS